MRVRLTPFVLAMAIAVTVGVRESQASAILNGSFEDSALWGWTLDTSTPGSLIFDGGGGHGGGRAAWFGAMNALGDSLAQSFVVSPGETYVLTFWLAHGGSGRANAFSVMWDDTPVLTLVNAARFGYQQYTFLHTPIDSLSTITFNGYDTFNYYRLDDVSVAPLVTPEPATLLLVGGGIAAICRQRLKSRTRARTWFVRNSNSSLSTIHK